MAVLPLGCIMPFKYIFHTEAMALGDIGEVGIYVDASHTESLGLEDLQPTLSQIHNVLHSEGLGLEDLTPTIQLLKNIGFTEALGLSEDAFLVAPVYGNVHEGHYRIENDYSDRYEIYLGQDQWPDFSEDPRSIPAWRTFTSFPYTLDAVAAGHTYYLVIRKRDQYGVTDGNVQAAIIRIDALGEEIPEGPKPPFWETLGQAPVGKPRFRASYNMMEDQIPADRWHVYFTSDGSDPDPTDPGDLYVDFPMVNQPVTNLDFIGPDAFIQGTVLKAIIRTYRTSDTTESLNEDILQITVDLEGPDVLDGQLWLGNGADK